MVVGGKERPRHDLGVKHRLRGGPKGLGADSPMDFLGFPFGWCSPPAFSLSAGDQRPWRQGGELGLFHILQQMSTERLRHSILGAG